MSRPSSTWIFYNFLFFLYRGKPRHNNYVDEHFLVKENVSPRSRQEDQNEAGRHLVFSRQGVSIKIPILFQFSRY